MKLFACRIFSLVLLVGTFFGGEEGRGGDDRRRTYSIPRGTMNRFVSTKSHLCLQHVE